MPIERIKDLISKYMLARVLLISTLLIAVLFFYFKLFFTTGVNFDNTFLRKEVMLSESRYIGKNINGDILITVKGLKNKDSNAVVTYRLPNNINRQYGVEFKDAGNVNIKDENGNIIFEGEYIKGSSSSTLIGKDGKPLIEGNLRILINGETSYNADYEIPLVSVADFANSAHGTIRGDFELLMPAILLFIITLIDVRFPLFFFLLNHAWDVKDPEPSDFYIAMQRISWYVFPIVGIGLMIAAVM